MTDEEQPPASGPTPGSVAAQDDWLALAAQNLPTVRESAGKWRDGLTALITLVTAGLVVSGPDKAGDLPTGWQWAIAIGLIGGMLAVLIGLFMTLGVAAGTPDEIDYDEFIRMGGSKPGLEAVQARSGAKRLLLARRVAIPGIMVVLIAIGAWLVSPTQPPSSLRVTTATEVLCGELSSGDHGALTLTLAGESEPAVVRYADVANVAVVDQCEDARTPR